MFYFVLYNVFTFFIFGIDKYLATKHLYRISENLLFTFALLFGALGCLFGMWLFRHKNRKKRFKYGLLFLTIVQLQVVSLIF